MELVWKINNVDVKKIQKFYNEHKDCDLVRNRKIANIKAGNRKLSKELFWESIIMCLLTTQQRSGPDSKINKFMASRPYPLRLKYCINNKRLVKYVKRSITEFGGIRRAATIAEEVKFNLDLLIKTNWQLLNEIKRELSGKTNIAVERKVAEKVQGSLKGFGPKQSRNLLQHLGLTVYEIPIDSRVVKRLNEFGFPAPLSASALQDNGYYNFVSDGIQQLCKRAKIKPCLLDAVLFSSSD